MKYSIFTFLLLTLISCKNSQVSRSESKVLSDTKLPFLFERIAILDPEYTETSGLEFYDNQIITHNDSGDGPRLYFLNESGMGVDKTLYRTMDNVDWEDICKDDTDLYIADIGNNHGNRKDLTIYKISLDGLKISNAPTTKMIINYPDQKSFKYGNQDHPYDAESIVAIDNHLYVFSKDWKDLTTVVYQFDKNGTQQKAKTITTHNVKGLITGATYNGKNKVMLCGYNSFLIPFIIPVTYQAGSFEFGEKYELPLSNGAQVEAISYRGLNENGNEVYYLSSEAVNIKLGEDEAKSNAELYKMIWTD